MSPSQRLPSTLDQHVIHGDRQRLRSQLTVVTKRLFAGILDKQTVCSQEMLKVEEVRLRLEDPTVSIIMEMNIV